MPVPVQISHPHVRKSFECPFCHGRKDLGTLACWPCFRGAGLKSGDPIAELVVQVFDDFLAEQDQRPFGWDRTF